MAPEVVGTLRTVEYQGPPQQMFCTRYGYRFEAKPMQAYCPHCGWACTEEFWHLPMAKKSRWVVGEQARHHRQRW